MNRNFMIEKLQTVLPPNNNEEATAGHWAKLPLHDMPDSPRHEFDSYSVYNPGLGDFDGMSVEKLSHVGFAGDTDVTNNSSRMALNSKMGYTRGKMSPTDDQYTGEMCDPFYDTMVVDGEEGFVERANYLDRI